MSAPRARHAHDRRPRGAGAEGHRARRGGARGRDRDPGLLLRAAPRAAGRRLPHVPRARSRACRSCRPRCTLTAADGMVVQHRADLGEGRRGQNATLEFILVNHPLDCPVCDKGGECPLQDLTFRYGPGQHADDVPEADVREADPDLADDRARPRALHPLLPLHALLRERRRGRPARRASNRGAASMIATFEDEPYRAPFSGNVIELCPVGALTSTQYRFEARPWEIQNVPTVCGLCPVGCNISATTREGKVKRILSRNHPEVDEGWLCDKGRFAFSHLYAGDRIADPLPAAGAGGFEAISWDDALDEAERLLRDAGRADRDRALRLGDGRAGLRARAGCCAAGSARTRRCCPRRRARRARRLPRCRSRRSATPSSSSSSATSRSSSARRSSTSGSRPPRARATARARSLHASAAPSRRPVARASARPDLAGDGASGATSRLARELGFAQAGSALPPAAHAERPRRRRRVGAAADDGEPATPSRSAC